MGSLLKGFALAVLGLFALVPVVLLIAVVGVPLAIVLGILALPVLLVVGLAGLPFLIVGIVAAVVIALVVGLAVAALKLAFFVVLPLAIVGYVVARLLGWGRRQADYENVWA
jgi:hypothetical protein